MIRFTNAQRIRKGKPRKASRQKSVLEKLNAFLIAKEPEAIAFLVSFWDSQAKAVTYQELREAYLSGGITQAQFERWQQDYSELVRNQLYPQWQEAANAAAAEIQAKYPHFYYEPAISASMGYIRKHGAELVTNLTQEQRSAVNAVIAHVSGYTAVTVDEAAQIIRPIIGLTKLQAIANTRYRESVKQAYLSAHPKGKIETAEKKAAEAAARYAARQHRYRAQNIARTELAYAYNAGAYGATKDAQRRGYLGPCEKVWMTAANERVCPLCQDLEGERRPMDAPFSIGVEFPPAHPSCRCAVAYEELPSAGLIADLTQEAMEMDALPRDQSGGATLDSSDGSMERYRKPDGSFDLKAAVGDYRKFLQSVPEKNRIPLLIALNGVEYQQTSKPAKIFAYDSDADVILFNPEHPYFYEYDFQIVNTHELGHRIDHKMFIQSWENQAFAKAIADARAVIDADPERFLAFVENDIHGFLSDIMSAICEQDYKFPIGHKKSYWLKPGAKEKEIFANLFSLEALEKTEYLSFFKQAFPDIWTAYLGL